MTKATFGLLALLYLVPAAAEAQAVQSCAIAIVAMSEAPGPNCKDGGSAFTTCTKVAGQIVLNTVYACNGADGMDGANGFDGETGPAGPPGPASPQWTWVDNTGNEYGVVAPSSITGGNYYDTATGTFWSLNSSSGEIGTPTSWPMYFESVDCTGTAYIPPDYYPTTNRVFNLNGTNVMVIPGEPVVQVPAKSWTWLGCSPYVISMAAQAVSPAPPAPILAGVQPPMWLDYR